MVFACKTGFPFIPPAVGQATPTCGSASAGFRRYHAGRDLSKSDACITPEERRSFRDVGQKGIQRGLLPWLRDCRDFKSEDFDIPR